MRRTGVVTDIAGLGAGDHVCWAYRSAPDYWRVLADFFRAGAGAHERLLFVGSRDQGERLRGRLAGLDLAEGQLTIATVRETYLDGGFDPAATIEGYRQMVTAALADGYAGLRGVADVTEMRAELPSLPAYELGGDVVAARLPITYICCYDARVWRRDELALIESVHPLGMGESAPGRTTGFRLYGDDDGSVRLEGEVDARHAEALGDLLRAARRTGATALDISALAFADAAAARVLATAGPIRGAPPAFRSVRRILRLAEVA